MNEDKLKKAWEKFRNSGSVEDYLEYKRVYKSIKK